MASTSAAAFVRAPIRFNSPFKLPRPQRRFSPSTSCAPPHPRLLQVQRSVPTHNISNSDINTARKMTFGGGAHDRQNSARTDKAYVERQLTHENAHYFVFDADLRILFDAKSNAPALYSYSHAKQVMLANRAKHDDNTNNSNSNNDVAGAAADIDTGVLIDEASKTAVPLLFLGTDDEGRPYCAIKTSAGIPLPKNESSESATSTFVSLREVASLIPVSMAALASQARSLFTFNESHLFCGTCGSPTISDHGGARRTCTSSTCPAIWYPRIDPAVIMLVLHPTSDSILLCRQPRYPPGMYSCIAGHMEHAEHIEDTVRRETHEETSVVLSRQVPVRFFRSQPWPFPHTLMLGCVARASTTHIVVDKDELEEARWFSREEIQQMVSARESAFKNIRSKHRHYRPRTAFDAATKADDDRQEGVDADAERHGNGEQSGNSYGNNNLIKFVPPNMAIAGEMIEAYLARDPIFDFDNLFDLLPENVNGTHVAAEKPRRPL